MSRQIRRQTLDLFYSRYSYVLWVWTLSPPRCKTEQHNLKICHEFFLNFSPAVSHSSYNTILDAERTSQLLRGVQRAQLYFFGVSAASYCIWSAGCLRSEAVNKGCVESLWRQPSRGDVTTRASAVHQQLSCSPPPPPWTQQEGVGAYGGAGGESQPAGSLHIAAQNCCFLTHKRVCLSD